MSSTVSDLLYTINEQVSQLSGTGLAKVASLLREAEQELARDLSKVLARVGGDATFTAQMYRNALMQIRASLMAIQARSPMLANVLKFGATQASIMATKHLIKEVEVFSKLFEGTVRPIALESASLLAEGSKTLWPRFHSSSVRYAGQVGEDIRRQLAVGVVRGETVDQLTVRLVRLGGPKGHVWTHKAPPQPGARGELISEGLFRRYGHWAERLVRTELVNSYNVLALEGIDQLNADAEDGDDIYKKRWDAAIDGRTCEFCKSLDHVVVATDKPFQRGVMHPPLHPRCRCAVVAWHESWTETASLFAEKRDQRASRVQSLG